MVTWLRQLLHAPTFTDEERTRTASLLNVILWTCLCASATYTVISFFLLNYEIFRVLFLVVLVTINLIGLILMRLGYVHSAGALLITTIWVLISLAVVFSGGVRALGYSGYVVPVLIAGLLFGLRTGFGVALTSVTAGLLMLFLELTGYLPLPRFSYTPVSQWALQTVYLLVTLVLFYLAIGNLKQALARARRTTQTLTEKNQELSAIRTSLEEHMTELLRINEEFMQEIAGRKRVEQALRASEDRLRTVVSNAPLILSVFDDKGVITLVEGQGLESAGLDPALLLGSPVVEAFRDVPEMQEKLALALAGKSSILMQQIGDAIFETRISPLRNEEGEITGIIGVSTDISERRQAERALRQAQKLESLGILAGGVAHDFNNLLVAVLGQTSLALAKLPVENPAYDHIEKAMKAAERAADLTRQLLAYSGRGQFVVLPLNLNTLIQENLHLFEVAIPKHVHLEVELASDLPYMEADAGQMQQVVMNLILNAAESIDAPRGTVTVTTGVQTVSDDDSAYWQNTGAALAPGRYITLEVHDTGNGMDRETLSRIFDPFFTTKATGRGLGLAAVVGIVRGHKGGLRVYSEVNRGTTFKLLFPALEEVPNDFTPVSPRYVPGSASGGPVLVIDDEAPVREAVVDILQLEGIEVITAASGEEGIALFRQRSDEIKLVLLDLSMPGMSGEEVFRALRKIDPKAPIVLSSGYNELEATHRFVGKGLAGFIQKPYSTAVLVEVVRRYLPYG